MLYTIEQLREVLLILHLFGVVIGFGGAVVTDRLFFHFLRDLRISRQESVVLKYVSQIIWAGIALIFLTGTLLFIPSASELLAAPKFQAKMFIFAILVVNGAFLHFFIHPTITKINFKRHHHRSGELHWYRRRAMISGAISLTSWTAIFLLGMLPRSFPATFFSIVFVYFLFAAAASSMALLVEKYLKTLGEQS